MLLEWVSGLRVECAIGESEVDAWRLLNHFWWENSVKPQDDVLQVVLRAVYSQGRISCEGNVAPKPKP